MLLFGGGFSRKITKFEWFSSQIFNYFLRIDSIQ